MIKIPLKQIHLKQVKPQPCPYCAGAPEPVRVGDWKQFWIYVCPTCRNTPVLYHSARLTKRSAVKEWNRQCKALTKYRKIHNG